MGNRVYHRLHPPQFQNAALRVTAETKNESIDPQSERLKNVLASAPPAEDGYKRSFDLFVVAVSHIVGAPILLLAWTLVPLAIWLTDRGPVFYMQDRVGKNGAIYRVIKFRTMIVDAERATGPIWARQNDRRVTPIGRILRRSRLDELPQIVNILLGEMSLVGPRPERPELIEEFSRDLPSFPLRLRVMPGIAGLAQVMGRYATTPRNKLRYDNLYIETLGPWLDLKLLVLSVWAALSRGHH